MGHVALETIVFPGDFPQIALNGIVSALNRHCQYSYQILTGIRQRLSPGSLQDFLRNSAHYRIESMDRRKLNKRVSNRVPPCLRIMLRISDWSEWGRLIICGAQEFALSRQDWQLHVSTGAEAITGNLGDIRWDGIMTHVFPNLHGIRRLWEADRTKIVSFTAVPPKALLHLPSVA